MFEEEIDLLSGKKSTKHGRRSSNAKTPPSLEEKDLLSSPGSPPSAPSRARKTGWWADEGTKSAKSKSTNLLEQERFQNDSVQEEDNIPSIPDIDDIQDDPLNLPDIKIPNVTIKQSTYKELDNQFEAGKTNFGNLGDIDLSILTNRLFPENEVQRCTDIWTMESLYQDLAKQ